MPENTADVTALLERLSNGEVAVADRRVRRASPPGASSAQGRRHDITLRTPELVHEAYFKLVDHSSGDWQDRRHFLHVVARATRQVLVEHARRKTAEKRGGDQHDLPLEEVTPKTPRPPAAILAVHQALERLAALDERQARVVECRFLPAIPH